MLDVVWRPRVHAERKVDHGQRFAEISGGHIDVSPKLLSIPVSIAGG